MAMMAAEQVSVPCAYPVVQASSVRMVPPASCEPVSSSSFPLSGCQVAVSGGVYVPQGSSIASLDATGSCPSLSLSASSFVSRALCERRRGCLLLCTRLIDRLMDGAL